MSLAKETKCPRFDPRFKHNLHQIVSYNYMNFIILPLDNFRETFFTFFLNFPENITIQTFFKRCRHKQTAAIITVMHSRLHFLHRGSLARARYCGVAATD